MLKGSGLRTPAALAYFEATVRPKIQDIGGVIDRVVRNQLAQVLFSKLAVDKAGDFSSTELPSVTRITELVTELDILRVPEWATLIMQLMQHLCTLSASPVDYSSIESYENAMARRDSLLHDLVGAWRVFITHASSVTVVPDSAEAEDHGGSASTDGAVSQPWPKRKPNYPDSFTDLFTRYPPARLIRPSWLAYATYVLLTDPLNSNRSIRGEAHLFLQMMNHVLPRSPDFRPPNFKTIFNGCPDLRKYLRSRLIKDGEPSPVDIRKSRSPSDSSPNITALQVGIHRQIGQAIKVRNIGALNQAWTEFWGEDTKPDAERLQQIKRMTALFDYFIFAFMAMRSVERGLAVWECMARIKVKPTIKTWNSMMEGCAKAKNPNGINAVWRKLVGSGTQLDVPIWTARISGLILGGAPDAGLMALKEMAETWRKRDEPGNAAMAVKPSIEPINAALHGLIRVGRTSSAQSVLMWAAQQGIEPDIYTFNTLLRPLVRQGKTKEVREVFEMMEATQVKADPATFTILLEDALHDVATQPPEQQVQTVTRTLDDLNVAGIDINMQMYGKMVYVLLQGSDRAGPAVNAVFAHIWGQGQELSSHIYTILAEHYFSRDPPDTAAVTALIESRKLLHNPDIDRVFWERVIKGYCHAGMTGRAFDIFEKVFKPGMTITFMSFSTLYDLLDALIRIDNARAAFGLVQMVKQLKEIDDVISHKQPNARYWKHRFWHLAQKHDLLDERLRESFQAVAGVDI